MPKRKKFHEEDEEKLINFVKSNEILYNVKNRRFRDTAAKNRLWLQLANELSMDVEVVKKKWKAMRDYFVLRSKENKSIGSAALQLSKRDESLSFLHQTSVLSRSSLSSAVKVMGPSTHDDPLSDDNEENALKDEDFSFNEQSLTPTSIVESDMTKTRCSSSAGVSAREEILREFLANAPKPADFMPEKPSDDIDHLFESLAITIRKFPAPTIARIKLKFAQIVGEEEIAWAINQKRKY